MRYRKLRFVAYAVPTTPARLSFIGARNGPGSLVGCYAAKPDFDSDVATRIRILEAAVDASEDYLHRLPREDDVLTIFMAPEFFFHGPAGPYLYRPGEEDPADVVTDRLLRAFPAERYRHRLFVFGSILSACIASPRRLFAESDATVRNAMARDLATAWLSAEGPIKTSIFDMLTNFVKISRGQSRVEVRNRALVLQTTAKENGDVQPLAMRSDKYFVSNADFLLFDAGGRTDVITETMTSYPRVDLSTGDWKQAPFDHYAKFAVGADPPIAMGLEICVDHVDRRLRRYGADVNETGRHPVLNVQLVPSCGMQILADSVAVAPGGYVFNCDGQYDLDDTRSRPAAGTQGKIACLYANYVCEQSPLHAAHSQLCRVAAPAEEVQGARTASDGISFDHLDPANMAVLPVEAGDDLKDCFAGGAGELHVYGVKRPYPIP